MSELRKIQCRAYAAFSGMDATALLPALRSTRLPASVGIEVYRNNFAATFEKTLRASYPVIFRLVGPDCFCTLARDHVCLHPSRSGDLSRFGSHFADILDARYTDTPFFWLGDVARLEWSCEEVRRAPAPAAADLNCLQGINEAELLNVCLRLQACRVVDSSVPVLSIWRANQEVADDEQASDGSVDLAMGSERVLVVRENAEIVLKPIGPAEAVFLAELMAREPLAAAIAAALAQDPAFNPDGVLQWLAVRRLIVAADLTPERHALPAIPLSTVNGVPT